MNKCEANHLISSNGTPHGQKLRKNILPTIDSLKSLLVCTHKFYHSCPLFLPNSSNLKTLPNNNRNYITNNTISHLSKNLNIYKLKNQKYNSKDTSNEQLHGKHIRSDSNWVLLYKCRKCYKIKQTPINELKDLKQTTILPLIDISNDKPFKRRMPQKKLKNDFNKEDRSPSILQSGKLHLELNEKHLSPHSSFIHEHLKITPSNPNESPNLNVINLETSKPHKADVEPTLKTNQVISLPNSTRENFKFPTSSSSYRAFFSHDKNHKPEIGNNLDGIAEKKVNSKNDKNLKSGNIYSSRKSILDIHFKSNSLLHLKLLSVEDFAASKIILQRMLKLFPAKAKIHNGYRLPILKKSLLSQFQQKLKDQKLFCSSEIANKRKTNQYEIVSPLGRGTHGIVFLGMKKEIENSLCINDDNPSKVQKFNKQVAIKIVDFSNENQVNNSHCYEDLLHEAHILNSCDHPNILKYHESFCWPPNYLILISEYVPGGSLKELCKNFGPLPEKLAAFVLRDILQCLKYLQQKHQNVIVHRDIKPSNIVINEEGISILIDFGFSLKNKEGFKSTELIGTPQYMAPETISLERGYGCSADIWSLGITGYELVVGSTPWPKNIKLHELLMLIAYGPSPRINLNEGFEKEFCFFLECCLQPRPSKRASVDELLNHPFIQKHCAQDDISSPTLSQWKSIIKSATRQRSSYGFFKYIFGFLKQVKHKTEKPITYFK